MLLKYLMKKEFIEHPELWMQESDGDFLVEEYGRQLKENVRFAVSWFDWTNEDTIKECANMMGWKYIANEYMCGIGLITLEAFLEPDRHSPFKLKCGALVSVYILGNEVCDVLTGPITLYFPDGEKSDMYDVSIDCQYGNVDLLKECIDLENVKVLSTEKPSPNCQRLVDKYQYTF